MEDNATKGIIQLYDGWVIMVDSKQWILARDTGRTDKKTKKPVYDVRGYYTRLIKALQAFGEVNIHLRLQNGCIDLSAALNAIREEHNRLQKFISENLPDA